MLEADCNIPDDVQGLHYPTILSSILSNRLARALIPISRTIQLEDNAIVVPGFAGEIPHHCASHAWVIKLKTDAHAHIVENGYVVQMPLAGSKSVQGNDRFLSLIYEHGHFTNSRLP